MTTWWPHENEIKMKKKSTVVDTIELNDNDKRRHKSNGALDRCLQFRKPLGWHFVCFVCTMTQNTQVHDASNSGRQSSVSFFFHSMAFFAFILDSIGHTCFLAILVKDCADSTRHPIRCGTRQCTLFGYVANTMCFYVRNLFERRTQIE